MKRLKVLISAYACEPGKGSEPGVGWNVAHQMARYHDVWVITRTSNASAIKAELARHPSPNLRFLYYDFPQWTRFWKRGARGVQIYYYLWQLGIFFVAKKAHKHIGFELIHHATFVKYWAPSFLSLLSVPFIWGPIGGGESAPEDFMQDFSLKGKVYERCRNVARWLGEHDPFVRLTAKRSSIILATTKETAMRISSFSIKEARLLGESSLSESDLKSAPLLPADDEPFRFIAIGRLLHWKGIHLGLRAFSLSRVSRAEFWVVGDGPERQYLEALARSLHVAERVRFFGRLSRENSMERLMRCQVLVHPSLHDSGGWVCLEGMAAGRPVICLDIGGPSVQVTMESGFKIPAVNPLQAVRDMADAMKQLAADRSLLVRMGKAGQERIRGHYTWNRRGQDLNFLYSKVTVAPATGGKEGATAKIRETLLRD